MPLDCSEITKNLERDCNTVIAQGLREGIYVGRISWITAVTRTGKTITGITLKSGKKLLKVMGNKFSNQLTVGFTEGEYVNLLPQTFRFISFDNTPEAEAELDNYVDLTDLFVVARQNGTQGYWKAIGIDTGMKLTSFEYDSNAETPAHMLTFTATNERKLPYSIKHMDEGVDDTDEYLESLALVTV